MFTKGNKFGHGRPVGSKNKLTPERIAHKGWDSGNLTFKLRPIQVKINNTWLESRSKSRKFVLNCSRRLGKSTWMFLKCVETCLTEPGVAVAYIAPVSKNLDQYLQDVAKAVFQDCPPTSQPKYYSQKNFYAFPNGSHMYCTGANRDSYNQLRGYKLRRGAIDEAAQIDNLRELLKDVLLPALFDSDGDVVIGSTPPVTPDHYFKELCDEAQLGGYYAHYTIYDAGYPPSRIMEWEKETVKKPSDKTTWLREYMAQFVVDAERALCPEWKDEYIYDHPRDNDLFQFYDKYFSLDSGVRDLTVGLFGYYDFKTAKLIIEDEFYLTGTDVRTDIIANEIKRKELILNYPVDVSRYADNDNLILIQDLCILHNVSIISVAKDSLEAMVNQVRLMVNEGRLIVSPNCKLLIKTLQSGIWNEHRTEFNRSEALGHMDAFAALMYMIRMLNTFHNPIPGHLNMNPYTHHIDYSQPVNPEIEKWRNILNLKKPEDEF